MQYLHVNDLFHSDLVKTVHDALNSLGLSDIWLSHFIFYFHATFKNKVKTTIAYQFNKNGKATLTNQIKLLEL